MTPQLARMALCSFAVLAAGVTINALCLQPSSQVAGRYERPALPAPVREPARATPAGQLPPGAQVGYGRPAATRAPAGAAQERRVVVLQPNSASLEAMPEVAEAGASAETVRAVQRELRSRGYGPLSEDGTLGLATRAAIMAFEHDQGLALTAEPSEQLLARIVLGAPAQGAAGDAASTARPPTARAREVIRAAQQRLAALGYQPGAADGRLSEETIAAIRFYEMDKGLVPKGRISAEIVARLHEPAPARSTAR